MAASVRKLWIAFALCLLHLGSSNSLAIPITWTLDGAVFDDGGTALGSFVYDAPTNTYSAINLTTTGGGLFTGASYHAVHPHFGSPSSTHLTAAPGASLSDYNGIPALLLAYSSALTDLGGTVALNTAGASIIELQCTTSNCSSGSGLRGLTSGSLVASRPVSFVLQGVTFDDGGAASGSFVYDVLNNIYSAIDITTTAGSAFGGAHYGQAQAGSDASQLFATNGDFSSISFTVATPLDDPGVVDTIGLDVLLVGALSRENQCLDSTCSTSSPLRLVTEGSVQSALPVPSSLLLGLLGGLALLMARRHGCRQLAG